MNRDAGPLPGPPVMTRPRRRSLDRRELLVADLGLLAEMARQVHAIDEHYRAAAEGLGRLYMRADLNRLPGLTRSLDAPMRRAADLERTFAQLLGELQACLAQRALQP